MGRRIEKEEWRRVEVAFVLHPTESGGNEVSSAAFKNLRHHQISDSLGSRKGSRKRFLSDKLASFQCTKLASFL